MKKSSQYKGMSPFIHWVGGKRNNIDNILPRLPKEYNRYFEPFVGGGALLWELSPSKVVINDFNEELINVYKSIRNEPYKLMDLLDIHLERHKKQPSDYYYFVREWDRKDYWQSADDVSKAARMIYLNRTCYKSLYRVNKKGHFNTPYNGKVNVSLYDRDNILYISSYLRNNDIKISSGDFEEVLLTAKAGDLVFLDPPYDPYHKGTFRGYNYKSFTDEDQIRLSNVAKELKDRGCYVMATNHGTEFIRSLYDGFNIDTVNVRRPFNTDKTKDKGVCEEVIMYSYEI